MTKQQKDVRRIIKHLDKAAEIASKHEILDPNGGFVDSQITTMATELLYKYIHNAPEHVLEAIRENAAK